MLFYFSSVCRLSLFRSFSSSTKTEDPQGNYKNILVVILVTSSAHLHFPIPCCEKRANVKNTEKKRKENEKTKKNCYMHIHYMLLYVFYVISTMNATGRLFSKHIFKIVSTSRLLSNRLFFWQIIDQKTQSKRPHLDPDTQNPATSFNNGKNVVYYKSAAVNCFTAVISVIVSLDFNILNWF